MRISEINDLKVAKAVMAALHEDGFTNVVGEQGMLDECQVNLCARLHPWMFEPRLTFADMNLAAAPPFKVNEKAATTKVNENIRVPTQVVADFIPPPVIKLRWAKAASFIALTRRSYRSEVCV